MGWRVRERERERGREGGIEGGERERGGRVGGGEGGSWEGVGGLIECDREEEERREGEERVRERMNSIACLSQMKTQDSIMLIIMSIFLERLPM